MSLVIKKNSISFRLTVLLLLGILFLWSCSKKDSNEVVPAGNVLTGDLVKLNVVVDGIDNVEDEGPNGVLQAEGSKNGGSNSISLKATSNNGNGINLTNTEQVLKTENKALGNKIVRSGGLEVLLSVQQEGKQQETALAMPTGATTSSPLAGGNKFRLLLYNAADGSFVSSTLFTMGVNASVVVSQGTTYNWFAYSYNDANDVADIPAAQRANPTMPTAVNRDLLYASGQVTTGKDIPPAKTVQNANINIPFKHLTTRVGVVLNAQGMFASLTSGTVQIDPTNFDVGTVNIKTGAVTNVTPATGLPSASSVNKNFPITGVVSNTARIAYFYTATTATPKTITNLPVTVTDFTLTLDDGSSRSFSGLTGKFIFPSVTLTNGKLLKVDLVESAVTVNGTSWARANLFWTGASLSSGTGNYVFRHFPDNRYSNLSGEFWKFKTQFPSGPTVGAVDACSLVYPAGTWRMPTLNEVNSLVQNTNLKFVFNAATSSGNWIEYTTTESTTGAATPYFSNKLILSFKGFTASGTPGDSFFNASNNKIAQFMAGDNPTGGGFVYNAGTVPFTQGTGSFFYPNNINTAASQISAANASNGYVYKASVVSSLGAPTVRCVRAKLYPLN
ncbi:hypothetical protein [Pedobacter cryoconitis]|uniref:Fimbrillin-like protein n=1 Tax=Pedobacter cryoconitis TaxID=188932 RepID=A0A7X0J506_9SPHI|nr:hypothetical protein [Pedobacter cryoconitis]MBB6500985.1 hypothetical protein [Pedobacter cryoconitis]